MQDIPLSQDIETSELCLQLHKDSMLRIQNCVFETLHIGQDLLQVKYNDVICVVICNVT